MWHNRAKKYYAAVGGGGLLMHTAAWRSLRCFMLSERTQTLKRLSYDSPDDISGEGKTVETEGESVVAEG